MPARPITVDQESGQNNRLSPDRREAHCFAERGQLLSPGARRGLTTTRRYLWQTVFVHPHRWVSLAKWTEAIMPKTREAVIVAPNSLFWARVTPAGCGKRTSPAKNATEAERLVLHRHRFFGYWPVGANPFSEARRISRRGMVERSGKRLTF